MMNEDTLVFLCDDYVVGDSERKVKGITIIIDGSLRKVMDRLLSVNPQYSDYTSIVRDAFLMGLNDMVKKASVTGYTEQTTNQ